MLTPQEITEKVFVKAVFGGYDMTGVDDFLESVTADYTALYKENAILKGKLKVLVEKVEEYRTTEDAMRMALLTAQRMGEEITIEANKKKDEVLRSAEMEARSRLSETAKKIADEELRLDVAAKETAKFIELSQAIMRKHSEFLSKLESARRTVRPDSAPEQSRQQAAYAPPQQQPQQPPQQPQHQQQQPQQPQHQQPQMQQQPIQHAPQMQQAPPMQYESPQAREEQIAGVADQIGDVMDRITGNGSAAVREYAQPYVVEQAPQVLQAYDEDDGDESMKLYMVKSEDEDEAVTPRPKFDFDDLKFGSNFDIK